MRDRIANWLQQNRQRMSEVAVGLGIPDSATMAVPVVEFGPDQSSTGRLEDRAVSPYLVHQVELEIACAGEPIHGDRSVTLARAITDQAGAGIRFFTFLAPATMSQRVQDPSVLGDLDDPDPVVFALALLDLALAEYLRSIHTLEGDHDEALRVADELLAFVAGSTLTTLVSVPVAGLATSVPSLESGPVLIRHLSPEEGGQLGGATGTSSSPAPRGRISGGHSIGGPANVM